MRKYSHLVPLDIQAQTDALAVLSKARIMIQNERQSKITRSKLKELLLDQITLNLPSDLHPRQVLARKNPESLLLTKQQLEIEKNKRDAKLRELGIDPDTL
jgi:hypothetical protein